MCNNVTASVVVKMESRGSFELTLRESLLERCQFRLWHIERTRPNMHGLGSRQTERKGRPSFKVARNFSAFKSGSVRRPGDRAGNGHFGSRGLRKSFNHSSSRLACRPQPARSSPPPVCAIDVANVASY